MVYDDVNTGFHIAYLGAESQKFFQQQVTTFAKVGVCRTATLAKVQDIT